MNPTLSAQQVAAPARASGHASGDVLGRARAHVREARAWEDLRESAEARQRVFARSAWGDVVFEWALRIPALALLVLLGLIAAFLYRQAGGLPNFAFLRSLDWDPVQESFGALPFIYGTLVSSLLAVAIAAPVGVGAALYLSELAPRRVAQVLGFLVEMLAAIPSVVYGLWGLFVLAPAVGRISAYFGGPTYGVGMLSASLVLAIMIIPTITSLSREVFQAVPRAQREAALALGSTRWEMMRLGVLKAARVGVAGAVILGLGRALGETMAVTMLIGNRAEISASLLAPAQTMASVIANEYAEAVGDVHLAALSRIGLALFGVTFVVNGLARLLVGDRKVRAT